MLKVKDKYDYRRELCEALRSGKYKQVKGGADHWQGNRVCALGVGVRAGIFYETDFYAEAAEKLGTLNIATEIWSRNDSGQTFCQIADYIESLP